MPRPFRSVRILVLGAHTGALQFRMRRFPARGDYLVADDFREAVDGAKGSNQAVAAARLGAQVTLLSAVGADERGHAALRYLAGQGIDVDPVLVSARQPTGFGAGFYLADGSVMGATYLGATAELTPAYLQSHADVFRAGFDACLVSLEIPLATAHAALYLARAAGIPLLILNPSPADALAAHPITANDLAADDPAAHLAAAALDSDALGSHSLAADDLAVDALAAARDLPPVDILTPNEPEARLLAGLASDGRDPMVEVAARVAQTYRAGHVIVTLGSEGCLVDGRAIPCPVVHAVDTSGAGDCFNSSLAVALAAGWPLPTAITFALAAASLSVTRPDSWPAYPTAPEVLAFAGLAVET